MRFRRAAVILITTLVTLFTVTGCWDRIEIEQRATVLGMAIDPPDESDVRGVTGPAARGEGPGFKVTAQIAIPGRIPLGPGGGSGGAASDKPVWVIQATGKTMDDAVSSLQQELAEKIFLGHLRVIIVNQELAKSEAFNDIQDFLRRNAEIRRLAWLLVSTGNAEEAMNSSPKLERVPTLYLVNMMDQSVKLGTLPNVYLGSFWSVLSSRGQTPVLPVISVREDEIRTQGLAIFHHGEMVGTLNRLETSTYMEIQNERRSGYAVAVPRPSDPSHSITVRGTTRSSKRAVHIVGGRPVFDVYSRIDSNIEEKTGDKPFEKPFETGIGKVQDELTAMVAQRQKELIARVQSLGVDIFGFGEYVRATQPAYWARIGNGKQWEEVFKTLQVRVHPRVYIRRSGMSAR